MKPKKLVCRPMLQQIPIDSLLERHPVKPVYSGQVRPLSIKYTIFYYGSGIWFQIVLCGEGGSARTSEQTIGLN